MGYYSMSVSEWTTWQKIKQSFNKIKVVRRHLNNGTITREIAQKRIDKLSMQLLNAVIEYREEKL